MSSRKKKKTPPKKFECSPGANQTFARLFFDMINSAAFKSLSNRQRTLYFYMKFQYYQNDSKKPNKNAEQFYFNKGIYKKQYNLYTNDESFRNDRNALIEHGFIICVEDGSNTRSKTVYQYSDAWQQYGTNSFSVEPKSKPASMLRKERNKE